MRVTDEFKLSFSDILFIMLFPLIIVSFAVVILVVETLEWIYHRIRWRWHDGGG